MANAINNPIGKQTPMEQRYIASIKEYNPKVTHITGDNNKVADVLSRHPQVTAMYVRVSREESELTYTNQYSYIALGNSNYRTKEEVCVSESWTVV